MAVQLSADVLDKLMCTFVTEMLNKRRERTLGFVCTNYTDEELYTMMNYVYTILSGCDYDDCDMNMMASKISPVEVCDSLEVITCSVTLSEVPLPETCDIYNLIQI